MEETFAFKYSWLHVVLLFILIATVRSATHKHLGCWMDTTAAPELNDLVTTPESLNLATCVTTCTKGGFAYIGIQGGKKCKCGNKYGYHGISTTCNYTCDGIPCGATDSNDIYYAINTDVTTRAKRKLIGYSEPKAYFDARIDCVKGNGDLVVMKDPGFFNSLITAANESGINADKVWIGLFWNSNNKYVWTNPSVNGLNAASNGPYWRPGERHDQQCGLLSLSAKDWITAACSEKHPYICFQLPADSVEAVTAPPDDTEFVETEEEKGFLQDNRKLVFYLVLPLFVLCYGGSCVIYAIGKCWRYFKKKKREKAREAMIASSAEFESDTKPLTLRYHSKRDVKMEEGYTNSPPPYYRVNSRVSKNRSPEEKEKPFQTPIQEFKAADDDDDDRPRGQSRASSRRSEFLENAYMEARERRRREGRTPEPRARPGSSASPMMTDLEVPPLPPPPNVSPKPRRSIQYQVLPSPDTTDIDYTKLSIGDIMYIRGIKATAEGEKRKRKKTRKIIVS